MDYASEIWLPGYSELAVIRKIDNDVMICWYYAYAIFFDVIIFLLLSLYVGASFMSMLLLVLESLQFLFIRVLTQNPEIKKTSIWTFSNILELERVSDAKFSMRCSY